MQSKIKIGTASWQDPGFIQDWYPPNLPKGDLLPLYAEHFHFVEVNSTFYGIPEPYTIDRWIRQTPPDFTFDIKLHKLLSRHSTKEEELPDAVRSLAAGSQKRVELTAELEKATIQAILRATEPLHGAGKLGAYLLQMTPGFSPRHNKLEELEPLIAQFHGRKLALELRNRNWLEGERAPATLDFCEDHGISLVMVDAPRSDHFTILPPFEAVTDPDLACLRLHGRNAEGYIRGRSVADRFNYDYSLPELEDIAQKVERVAREAREVHVVFNNNKSSYAPRNAETFQELIEQTLPLSV